MERIDYQDHPKYHCSICNRMFNIPIEMSCPFCFKPDIHPAQLDCKAMCEKEWGSGYTKVGTAGSDPNPDSGTVGSDRSG